MKKLFLWIFILASTQKGFSQVFIKFVSIKGASQEVKISLSNVPSGGETKISVISSTDIHLPSNIFFKIPFDCYDPIIFSLDYLNQMNAMRQECHCGDSILVDMDKNTTTIIKYKIKS